MPLHFPDANILIHCLREEAAGHEVCRRWLGEILANQEPLALCELVQVALLRISTIRSLKIAPVDTALGFWDDLRSYPEIVYLVPGAQHRAIFQSLVETHELRGNDMNDAWLAALAIEHNATLVSADDGFRRFGKLQVYNPLAKG